MRSSPSCSTSCLSPWTRHISVAALPHRRHLAAVAGVLVSAVLLWWVLRDVDWAAVRAHVVTARLLPMLAAVAVATSTFVLRVFRWRLLLRREDDAALAWTPLWHAIAIGFMGNNVLPFRMGEVMRSYAVTRLAGVRFTASLSSVAVERVFDGLSVVLLMAVGLVVAGLPSSTEVGGVPMSRIALVSGATMGAALLAGILVVSAPLLAERIIRRLVPSDRIADRLVALVEGVRHGLGVLRSPVRVVAVAAWSLGLWLVNATSFWIMFAAFDIPVGLGGALVMQGVLIFGIAVPSTPGYVGVFEAAIKAVLLLFGVGAAQAVAYAVTYHVTTFLPIVLLGAWSLARTSLGLRELQAAPPA